MATSSSHEGDSEIKGHSLRWGWGSIDLKLLCHVEGTGYGMLGFEP
jgi:hypothetical protein